MLQTATDGKISVVCSRYRVASGIASSRICFIEVGLSWVNTFRTISVALFLQRMPTGRPARQSCAMTPHLPECSRSAWCSVRNRYLTLPSAVRLALGRWFGYHNSGNVAATACDKCTPVIMDAFLALFRRGHWSMVAVGIIGDARLALPAQSRVVPSAKFLYTAFAAKWGRYCLHEQIFCNFHP